MTTPPHDGDREGGAPQPGSWPPPTGPLQPPRPEPDSQYGRTWQPPGQQPYGQPPYGQTPHAQPYYGAPQPARKSRAGLIALLVGGALVVAALAWALFAGDDRGFGSVVLDPHAVERDVAEQFEHQEGVAVDLDCAERMTVEDGASYPCTGVTADGEPVTLQITITDEDEAAYTWSEQ